MKLTFINVNNQQVRIIREQENKTFLDFLKVEAELAKTYKIVRSETQDTGRKHTYFTLRNRKYVLSLT